MSLQPLEDLRFLSSFIVSGARRGAKVRQPTAGVLISAMLVLFGAAPSFARDGPPIFGTVQNFIVFDKPTPAPPDTTNCESGR